MCRPSRAARLAYFSVRSLRDLVAERAKVGQALWRDCLVDASIFQEWVLNVGRRDAKGESSTCYA